MTGGKGYGYGSSMDDSVGGRGRRFRGEKGSKLIIIYIYIISLFISSYSYSSNFEIYECNHMRFQEFGVELYLGPIAKTIDFNRFPEAKKFRSAIQRALAGGVNFAGHYSAAVWGCGSNCIGLAIVDAVSGKVVFYSGTSLSYDDLVKSEEKYDVPLGILFVPTSNLLLANPTCETDKSILINMKHMAFGDGSPRYYIYMRNKFMDLTQ